MKRLEKKEKKKEIYFGVGKSMKIASFRGNKVNTHREDPSKTLETFNLSVLISVERES